jgi:hypothetical protein
VRSLPLGRGCQPGAGPARLFGGGHSYLTLRMPKPRGISRGCTSDRSKLLGSDGSRQWSHVIMKDWLEYFRPRSVQVKDHHAKPFRTGHVHRHNPGSVVPVRAPSYVRDSANLPRQDGSRESLGNPLMHKLRTIFTHRRKFLATVLPTYLLHSWSVPDGGKGLIPGVAYDRAPFVIDAAN